MAAIDQYPISHSLFSLIPIFSSSDPDLPIDFPLHTSEACVDIQKDSTKRSQMILKTASKYDERQSLGYLINNVNVRKKRINM